MRHAVTQTREFERRDITARTLSVRADSLDEEAGSVEAVVSSERPVAVFDFLNFRIVDEILVTSGGSFPERIPLLDSHHRSRSSDVLGSATGFRNTQTRWIGRAVFDLDDENATRIFGKIRNKHIRDVSIGYSVSRFTDIPPGKSKTVNGRTYTAGTRVLRISTKWEARELSVTPIGADQNAKFRDSAEDFPQLEITEMNPRLLAYLRRLGLSADSNDEQAREFMSALVGCQRSISNLLDYDVADSAAATSADVAIRSLGFDPADPNNVRADPPALDPPALDPPSDPPADGPSYDDGLRAERERQTAIRTLAANDIPDDLVTQAISDGITREEASDRFLAHIRNVRSEGRGSERPTDGENRPGSVGDMMVRSMSVLGVAPAAQATTRDSQNTAISMSMALMERCENTQDVVANFVTMRGRMIDRPNARHNDELERAAEYAQEMRGISLVDVASECLRMNGEGSRYYSAESVVSRLQQSARSTATFTGIITTNFSAQLLAGYDTAMDTTAPWTREGDLPDFRTADRPRVQQGDPLTKHARGGEAEHLTYSDKMESYKAARYSGQFVLDDMDIIDDRLGAAEQTPPVDMGVAARQLRPDLVYSILFANANMSDSVALFHATHSNLNTSSAFAVATAKAAITDMNTQAENGRLLDKNAPITFIMPEALSFEAEQLLSSDVISNDSGKGNRNPLASRATNVISDGRLDNGVTDPNAGTVHSGSATTWYVARAGSRHTIEVGYVRGSGRTPSVRSYILSQGRWGIGWDVKLDIGAKALDWLGLQKNTA